jgi:hypothetical protein
MATEAYQPFLQRFMSIVDGPPSMMHVDLEPSGDALSKQIDLWKAERACLARLPHLSDV